MLVYPRRAASVIVLTVVGAVLLGVSPASAGSSVGDIPRLSFTASQTPASLGQYSSSAFQDTMKATGGGYASPAQTVGASAGKVGLSSGAAGAAGTAVTGFMVGTDIGSGVAVAMGLPSTGNFFCDVGSLFGTCGITASTTYVPNSDIAPLAGAAGYSLSNVTSWSTTVGVTASAQIAFQTPVFSGADPYGAQAYPSFQVSYAYNGTISSGSVGTPVGVRALCKLSSGAVQSTIASGSSWYGSGSLSLQNTTTAQVYSGSGTMTLAANSCPNGQTFYGLLMGAFGTNVSTAAQVTANVAAGSSAIYRTSANPDRPPAPEGNAQRHWRTDYQCTSGPGGSLTSGAFTETDTSWPAIPAAQCEAGVVSAVKVWQTTAGASDTLIYQWDLPAEYGAANPDPDNCSPATPCELDLGRKPAPDSTGYVSCFDEPSMCTDWWTETEAGTKTGTDTDYRCTYGTVVIALTECVAYKGTFTATPTLTNPRNVDDVTEELPDESSSCPPPFTWTSLVNPWWYYKATGCALSEAFVPSDGYWTQQSGRISSTLGTKAPFSVIKEIPGMVDGFSDGFGDTTCSQMPNFSTIEDKPLRLPCEPPDSVEWRAAYLLMQVLVGSGVVLALWHMGHRAVGAGE